MSRSAIRERPATLAVPLVLFCALVAIGVWAVIAADRQDVDNRKAQAVVLSQQVAGAFQSLLRSVYDPGLALALVIERIPEWTAVQAYIPSVAQRVLSQPGLEDIAGLQIAPFSVVEAVWPRTPTNVEALGVDIFSLGMAPRLWQAIVTRSLVVTGPLQLAIGDYDALLAHYPVFVDDVAPDELFGRPAQASGCTVGQPPCYNATTRSLYWGHVATVLNFELLMSRPDNPVTSLEQAGYLYSLVRPGGDGGFTYSNSTTKAMPGKYVQVCANTNTSLTDPVTVPINVDLAGFEAWTLLIAPDGGWSKNTLKWLIPLVVVLSAAVSNFIFLFLVHSHRSHMLLRATLPEQVIRTLQRHKQYAHSHSCISVLFADIVGYTSLCAKSNMSASDIVDVLNDLFGRFDQLSRQHGVFKVDIVGDCYLCICGAPEPREAVDAATRIARMSQDIIRTTAAFVTKGGLTLKIRVGVHSGPAVAAVLGIDRPHYTVIGDTVNTASRLESTSETMKIQMSPTTAFLLSHVHEFDGLLQERGDMDLKGLGAVRTFWLDVPTAEQQLMTARASTNAPARAMDVESQIDSGLLKCLLPCLGCSGLNQEATKRSQEAIEHINNCVPHRGHHDQELIGHIRAHISDQPLSTSLMELGLASGSLANLSCSPSQTDVAGGSVAQLSGSGKLRGVSNGSGVQGFVRNSLLHAQWSHPHSPKPSAPVVPAVP